ncbi:MAG: ABC transporter permease subunit [Gemmataceae bacterium]|nr:ABC transporter permease subunit [Gemmataceae bacterium]
MTDSAVIATPVETLPPRPRPTKPPREWKLLGPHFFFDIIRLARSKRVRDLRMLYTFGMLIALLLLYMGRFRWLSFYDLFFGANQAMSINELAGFAERFVFSILFVQNLAVFLLTPIYLGSCITEEKERRSLELLFMSPLRNHEILFGKLFARMAHLAGVLLAGLPILSLAQLWGGIDMATLVLNFANTFLNLFSVGCFSLLVSVLMKRTLHAVMTIYGVMLPFLLFFSLIGLRGGVSPFGFLQFHAASLVFFMVLACLHLLLASVSIVMAHVFLRRPSELPPRWLEPPLRQPRRRQNAPEQAIRRVRDFDVPPVSDPPLLWKEYFFGPRPHSYLLFWLLSTIFLFAPIGMASLRLGPDRELDTLGYWYRFYAAACAMFFVFWSAFRAAGSIVRERQHKTLDELLTIPVERGAILGYKWLGSALHGWIFAAYFVAVVIFGVITTATHVAAGIFLLGSFLIQAFFWTTLGLYYSVVCRTVLAAYLRLGLSLLFVIVATALYGGIIGIDRNDWAGYFLSCGLNPPASIWWFGFTSHEFQQPHFETAAVKGCLAGSLIYTLLAGSLWLMAYGKFQRERFRSVE